MIRLTFEDKILSEDELQMHDVIPKIREEIYHEHTMYKVKRVIHFLADNVIEIKLTA